MLTVAVTSKPRRFPKPADLEARWWLRVEKRADGCWQWVGAQWKLGYGKFTEPGTQRRVGAHRWGYERFVGPIPDGLELDHLCRNPSCVNPSHLEPVTHLENVRRGISGEVNGGRQRSKTHCPRGHEYTAANTYYRRDGNARNCRACGALVTKRRKAEKRLRVAA